VTSSAICRETNCPNLIEAPGVGVQARRPGLSGRRLPGCDRGGRRTNAERRLVAAAAVRGWGAYNVRDYVTSVA
jgi:hypothetical protein